MHVLQMNRETAMARGRSRRLFGVSLGLHALLFIWLLVGRHLDPVPEGLVEVTWLDPAPAPAPVEIKAPEPPMKKADPVRSEPAPREQKFVRVEKKAEVKPRPQDLTANRDKVRDRLKKLQPSSLVGTTASLTSNVSSSLLKSAAAAAPAPRTGTPAPDLKRSEGRTATPIALNRSAAPRRRPVAAAADVAVAMPSESRAAADLDLENVSRRSLKGAELAGEVADRPLVQHGMPAYPEWATTEAIEATVTLYFEVLPDGRVKENVQVRKTAGFADFDRNAVRALLGWRFESLPDGATVDQWGTITFRYRLRG